MGTTISSGENRVPSASRGLAGAGGESGVDVWKFSNPFNRSDSIENFGLCYSKMSRIANQ